MRRASASSLSALRLTVQIFESGRRQGLLRPARLVLHRPEQPRRVRRSSCPALLTLAARSGSTLPARAPLCPSTRSPADKLAISSPARRTSLPLRSFSLLPLKLTTPDQVSLRHATLLRPFVARHLGAGQPRHRRRQLGPVAIRHRQRPGADGHHRAGGRHPRRGRQRPAALPGRSQVVGALGQVEHSRGVRLGALVAQVLCLIARRLLSVLFARRLLSVLFICALPQL